MNQLMTKIYSAMSMNDDLILDQIYSDIDTAMSIGKVESEEYDMTYSDEDGSVIIHDKVHNEDTKAVDNGSEISLSDMNPKDNVDKGGDLVINSEVTWTDSNGEKRKGILREVGDDQSVVELDGKKISVNTELLKQMETAADREFSRTRARKYVVDGANNIIAFGWESSLGRILKSNPSYKMVSEYDLGAYKKRLTKKFSVLSEENQRLFTKQNRRYVILDATGKQKYVVDIDNVKGLIQHNPGFTAMKETEYNKMQQAKFKTFSESNQEILKEYLKSRV